MNRHAESDTGDITADLAALRKDVAQLAESLGKLALHQTQADGLHVSEVPEVTGDKIQAMAAIGKKHMRVAARGEVEASIERNTVVALLIGFGIGLSLGVLVRSRA